MVFFPNQSNRQIFLVKWQVSGGFFAFKRFDKFFDLYNLCNGFQGSWYHKNCFRCVDCSRLLDSLTNNDGPDGQLYCNKCYAGKFGPQIRSTDVDHKISDTSLIKSEDPTKNCPRCGGAVFKAEAVPCKDRLYHKKCACCAACEKPLTYNTIFSGKYSSVF